MKESCLIVVFNHRYDKNLVKIKELYQKRFSDIYVIMPFYDGQPVDGLVIIPVFENSYNFSGYIAQAYEIIKRYGEYKHYVIIGDDLVLNPLYCENNIAEKLSLSSCDSYIKSLLPLSKSNGLSSKRVYEEVLVPFWKYRGIEYKDQILSCEEAKIICEKKAIQYDKSLNTRWLFRQITTGNYNFLRIIGRIIYLIRLLVQKKKGLPYPLLKSYSDFIVVSNKDIKKLAHYFGVFAAMGIFVEVAIPTAMAVICENVVTENMIDKHGVEFWSEAEKKSFENEYSMSVNNLFEQWDNSVIYYHPVKLSKWKMTLGTSNEL